MNKRKQLIEEGKYNISVWVLIELHDEFKRLVKKKFRTMSSVANELISKWVEENKEGK